MILAIVQARMSSSRLPGKVMKPILGRAMVAHQMDRLGRCTSVDRLVLATSREASDEPLEALVVSNPVLPELQSGWWDITVALTVAGSGTPAELELRFKDRPDVPAELWTEVGPRRQRIRWHERLLISRGQVAQLEVRASGPLRMVEPPGRIDARLIV